MAITEISGDILSGLDKGPTVVCHQVNCMGVMGTGLAKQIKDRFPIVYKAYKIKCKCEVNTGDVQFCKVSDNIIVANCFAQYGYGRDKCYTDYNALAECMKKIHSAFTSATIRIPYKIGCGCAGGKWNIVEAIIKSEFDKSSDRVEIWSLPYGYKASV